jgi:hypothetical protein
MSPALYARRVRKSPHPAAKVAGQSASYPACAPGGESKDSPSSLVPRRRWPFTKETKPITVHDHVGIATSHLYAYVFAVGSLTYAHCWTEQPSRAVRVLAAGLPTPCSALLRARGARRACGAARGRPSRRHPLEKTGLDSLRPRRKIDAHVLDSFFQLDRHP